MKWLLAGVGVLLVVAITVGVTVLVTRDGSGGGGPTTSTSAAPPIASADDTGAVQLITVEPTCDSWRNLQRTLATAQSNGWGQRDASIPASDWTSAQRDQFEAVGESMRSTAERAITLAKQTPHRAMRELYGQFTAYGRAYADAVANYKPDDDYLARANVGFSKAISGICDAIEYGNVISRSSGLPAVDAPATLSDTGSVDVPTRFLVNAPQACIDWIQANARFETAAQEWSRQDPEVPASAWSPAQQSLQERAAATFRDYASNIETIGRESRNSDLEDLSTLAALYLRAYSQAIPIYVPTDNYLIAPGLRLNNAITAACQSTGG